MSKLPFIVLTFFLLSGATSQAQKADSTIDNLQQIPIKYITSIDKKASQYTSRIASKTEKTLTKLSRWETKIKNLLQKTSPETADRLFGNSQLTFSSLLQQLKKGEALALQYKAPYSKYRDDVTTSFKYLHQQKEQLDSNVIRKVKNAGDKMQQVATEEDNSAAMQEFIKDRKKQLIEQTFSQIGSSKYLVKINKEAYYYGEALRNYKELFSDSKKAEDLAKTILNKIPAFQRFIQQNSQLATMFRLPGNGLASMASLAGLQTRASIQSIIQDRIASGGPNAQEQISQNLQAAQAEMTKLKDKLMNATRVGGSAGGELPDFKPNAQRSKTFGQRMDYGFNLQFDRTNNLLPAATNLGLSVGYKINDKSVVGIGASYKLGMGTIDRIRFSHQGIGLRSFIDWKLKKQIFVGGGYELNHNAQFRNIAQLKTYDAWQRSALLGITKKMKVKTKLFKATNIQLLYDFLSSTHLPVSQPVIFRMGYSIN
jgi:hypothetical protein